MFNKNHEVFFQKIFLKITGNEFIGDVKAAEANQGASLMDSKKTGGEKRKRERNMDASDLDNYTGNFSSSLSEAIFSLIEQLRFFLGFRIFENAKTAALFSNIFLLFSLKLKHN